MCGSSIQVRARYGHFFQIILFRCGGGMTWEVGTERSETFRPNAPEWCVERRSRGRPRGPRGMIAMMNRVRVGKKTSSFLSGQSTKTLMRLLLCAVACAATVLLCDQPCPPLVSSRVREGERQARASCARACVNMKPYNPKAPRPLGKFGTATSGAGTSLPPHPIRESTRSVDICENDLGTYG